MITPYRPAKIVVVTSRTNCRLSQDVTIAQAYLDEWCQLLALSEQLDWEDPYVTPQWRIGT